VLTQLQKDNVASIKELRAYKVSEGKLHDDLEQREIKNQKAIEKLEAEHLEVDQDLTAVQKQEGIYHQKLNNITRRVQHNLVVNSGAVTKLGKENRISIVHDQAEIAKLKQENLARKQQISDLKSQVKLNQHKTNTKLGVEEDDIKTADSENKEQDAALTKLANEDKAEEAQHEALTKTVAGLTKTQQADQKEDVKA
jgi:hypothetical protein